MNCSDVSSRIGHALLFIGNECRSWSLAQFADAARRARDLGFDGIVPKRADGELKWYGNLSAEKQAVEEQGVKYIPFLYAYGPKFGNTQIERECALIAEIQAACGVCVVDMEVEWNGNVMAAQYFVQCMKQHPSGTLIISTWGDPVQQRWTGVVQALNPIVTAWWPQLYSNWLAAQYHQFSDLQVSCIQPTVDLSKEAGANNPVDIVSALTRRRCTTISVWEYELALIQEETTKLITGTIQANVGRGGQKMGTPMGWKDDGTTLVAPNGHKVVMGFRQWILDHAWDALNVPLCEEYHAEQVLLHNPAVGAGQVQLFRDGMLWYTLKSGVVMEPYIGMELYSAYQEIASLKAQLQAPPPAQTVLPDDVKAALKTLATFAGTLA